MYNDDEPRVRYECKTCCHAISGGYLSGSMLNKIRKHEEETGHVMDEVYDA